MWFRVFFPFFFLLGIKHLVMQLIFINILLFKRNSKTEMPDSLQGMLTPAFNHGKRTTVSYRLRDLPMWHQRSQPQQLQRSNS